jgi:hypothetical protein
MQKGLPPIHTVGGILLVWARNERASVLRSPSRCYRPKDKRRLLSTLKRSRLFHQPAKTLMNNHVKGSTVGGISVVWAPNERASVLPPAFALVPPEDYE